jgi:hypothetical protein
MGGVFISYRREDSQGEALHLFDDLKEHFGIDRIFMDVTGIDPGKDFRKVIENAVTTCDVLIVMIGKKWIDAVDEEGKRRLDDPKDFVRIEATAALHRDVPVIPVLVQGAGMPRPKQLPAEIEALAWRNAFELRHNRWSIDVAELVTALRKVVPGSSTISSEENKSQRWWQAFPGALAGLAGFIGAVTALAIAFQQIGVFHNAPESELVTKGLPADLCQNLHERAIDLDANKYRGVIGPSGIDLRKTSRGFQFETVVEFYDMRIKEEFSDEISDTISGVCEGNAISLTRLLRNDYVQRFSGKISRKDGGEIIMEGTFKTTKDDKESSWYGWIIRPPKG